ncbi:pre-mRNA-splicing factor 38A-like [Haliotis rubra]|uniref:pre-mRNA-splicing factor 38A-like n=1 Tax=Haliotis rubra TaxID=36100 RepID=UPI001EE57F79|nr:pre-mRNA-splicing factor 38A-like [Haliotis rubra]
MANRTVKDAHSIKGTNPQYLVEKIIRTRIYECRYWKEECFALTAALMVDKAMELRYMGGIYGGNIKPTPFLCLVLKMLQIQPEKDIVVEFIRNEDFKYVRALGATYMRLVGTSLDCYKYLEPLYYDYRKLRHMNRSGEFEVLHMDEFIDELLREERLFDIILPRIQKRAVLEETNQLEPRVSAVEEDLEDMETDEEEELVMESKRSPSPEKSKGHRDQDKARSPSPRFRRSRSRSPHRRDRDKSPSRRKRSRSRERERRHGHRSHKEDDDDRRRRSKKSKKDKKDDDRHRDRDRDRERDKDRSRHQDHDRDRRDRGDRSRGGGLKQEIKEANELRARLGLAPLRQ